MDNNSPLHSHPLYTSRPPRSLGRNHTPTVLPLSAKYLYTLKSLFTGHYKGGFVGVILGRETRFWQGPSRLGEGLSLLECFGRHKGGCGTLSPVC